MDLHTMRSWTLIIQAAGKFRDYGFSLAGENAEKITVAQERILQVVMQHSPQGIMLKEVARQVQLTPGAVSQLIEVLVRGGLVERISDPHDRRAVNIHVTEKYQQLRNKVCGHFDSIMESIFMEKSQEECAMFVDTMRKIVAKFSGTNESLRRYAGETLLAMEDYK